MLPVVQPRLCLLYTEALSLSAMARISGSSTQQKAHVFATYVPWIHGVMLALPGMPPAASNSSSTGESAVDYGDMGSHGYGMLEPGLAIRALRLTLSRRHFAGARPTL